MSHGHGPLHLLLLAGSTICEHPCLANMVKNLCIAYYKTSRLLSYRTKVGEVPICLEVDKL